jgi:Peptidase A4 family
MTARTRPPHLSRSRRALCLCALGTAVACLASAATAAAQQSAPGTTTQPIVSANWAGYSVAAPTSAAAISFRTVSGSWVQPTATCNGASQSFSAYWVGLGGFAQNSSGLEQIGSEADCDGSGHATYSAWYELVPAGPQTLKMTVSPGDQMGASVTVIRKHVTLRLRDVTTGAYISKTLRMSTPDTSSADWIVEAPSDCSGSGNCVPLPLSDFGNLTFSNATAATATHTGPISDPAWSATELQLSDGGSRFGRGRFFGAIPSDSAVPSPLSAPGTSFSVAWQQQTIPSPAGTGSGGGVYPGFGGGGPS